MKPTRSWILVADAGKARIFANLGVGKGLVEVTEGDVVNPLPKTREIGSDKPGRSFESANSARHSLAPRADWHEQAKEEFARELAAWLRAAHQAKSYERLILAAPPKTLGSLRRHLDPKVAETVTGEIDKDLTNCSTAELETQLAKLLPL